MMRTNVSMFLAGLALASSAACGGKGATAQRPTSATSPYAGLFTDRAGMTYRYTVKTSMYDPDDPCAGEGGNVVKTAEVMLTCATKTRTVGAWQVAELGCTGAEEVGLVDGLVGTYVANADGLWRLAPDQTADDGGLAALAGTTPLLAAAPVPVDERKEEEGGQFGEFRKVSAAGGGWCVETGGWGGDEAGDGICFDPAQGISKVTRYFAGGSTKDELIELVQ
jgi:hypothetical protein